MNVISPSPTTSPCIRVCVMDAERDICVGCGRTMPEIVSWGGLDEAARRHVMAQLPDRLRPSGVLEAGAR